MPFIPLHDDNPTSIMPWVTWSLLGACVFVFLWQFTLPPGADERAVYAFGMIPAVLFGQAELDETMAVVPSLATLVTSMFLHGGILHLAGNMLYLWIFGNNVEDGMGHGRFLGFYLLCGVIAAFTHAMIYPDSDVPVIGASGAISGVLGAYLLLHPKASVLVMVFFPLFLRLPAWIVIGIWFAGQAIAVVVGGGGGEDGGGVAWWAHVAGFLAGMALVYVFHRPQVALFDRGRTMPRAPRIEKLPPDQRERYRRGPWG